MVERSTWQNSSFRGKFARCLGKCPILYCDLFFKPEFSVSDKKKEYGTMSEGKVGKDFAPQENTKVVGEIKSDEHKNLRNTILGHDTSYYKREFSPNFLRMGKIFTHDSSAPLQTHKQSF